MAAHWELAPNFAQLMRPRAAHMRSMATMGASLVRNLGMGGTARYAGAIRSVGKKGKKAVRAYLGTRVDDLDKVIASGNVVTANCTVDGHRPPSSRRSTGRLVQCWTAGSTPTSSGERQAYAARCVSATARASARNASTTARTDGRSYRSGRSSAVISRFARMPTRGRVTRPLPCSRVV